MQRTEQVLIAVEGGEVAATHVFALRVMNFEIFALDAVGENLMQMRMTRFLGMGDCLPQIGRGHGQEICRQRDAWQTAVYF